MSVADGCSSSIYSSRRLDRIGMLGTCLDLDKVGDLHSNYDIDHIPFMYQHLNGMLLIFLPASVFGYHDTSFPFHTEQRADGLIIDRR